MKKDKPIDLNNIKEQDRMKYEIAEELGLLPKLLEGGWKSLSSKESGRIGGIITNRKRRQKTNNKENL